MRYILGTIVTAVALSVPATAGAGDFYVGLMGGASLATDQDLEGTGIDSEASLDLGAGLAGAVGYRFGNGFRAEAEVGYRWNGIDDVSGTDASGDVRTLSGMANLLYDIDTGSAFTPYLGAGAGAAHIKADGVSPVSSTRVDDSDIAAAVQGLAGLAYRLDDQWSVTADYQYFTSPDVTLRTDSGIDLDTAYSAHTFRVGLRFDFGGPAPQKSAEESPLMMSGETPDAGQTPAGGDGNGAPPAQHSFLAFFDWDSAKLGTDALSVVARAAEQAKRGGSVRIRATGHADRSGPEGYNMKLSERRAIAVRDELVRLGVAADRIGIAWKGESEPKVPTEDGERHPENRRVEIVFP